MTTATSTARHPQPGDTWVNPYGRAFLVEQVNVPMHQCNGAFMGLYGMLRAKDDRQLTMAIYMHDLHPQVQLEMLI